MTRATTAIVNAIIVGATVITLGEIVRAFDDGQTVHVSVEMWIALGGGLIGVGANLAQLRQTRTDVKELKAALTAMAKASGSEIGKLAGRHDSIESRLIRIERTVAFVKGCMATMFGKHVEDEEIATPLVRHHRVPVTDEDES